MRINVVVAPRAGAWIETTRQDMRGMLHVAPRAGAWIETILVAVGIHCVRRAPRGRVD